MLLNLVQGRTMILLIVLLVSTVSCNRYCKQLVGLTPPPERPQQAIPQPDPTTLSIPIQFTAATVSRLIQENTPETLVAFDETSPKQIELKDSNGVTHTTVTLDAVTTRYGISKGGATQVKIQADAIILDIPLKGYAYIKTDLKLYESLAVLGQIGLMLNLENPTLRHGLNEEVLNQLDKIADEIGDPAVRNSLKELFGGGRKINDLVYQEAMQPAYDVVVATASSSLEANRYYWETLEHVFELNPDAAGESLGKMIGSLEALEKYLEAKIDGEVTRGIHNLDGLMDDVHIGGDIRKVIIAPMKITQNTIKETINVIKNPKKAAEKAIKKIKCRLGFCLIRKPDSQTLLAYAGNNAFVFDLKRDNDLEKFINSLRQQQWKVGCGEPGEPVTFTVTASIRIKVNRDFTLSLAGSSVHHAWTSECTLIKLPIVGDLINGKIEDLIDEKVPDLIGKLEREIKLRDFAAKGWDEIQQTVEFEERGTGRKIFSRFNPEGLYIDGLLGARDTARFVINIQARPQLSFAVPLPAQAPKPLPDTMTFRQNFNNGLSIVIDASVPFDSVEKILNEKYKNFPLEFEVVISKKSGIRKKIRYSRIKRFELFGDGEKMFIAVCVKGFVTGKLYIEGTPAYSDNGIVYLDKLDYSVETRHILSLMNIAQAVFPRKLEEALANTARYNLQRELKPKIEEANANFFNQQFDGIRVSGNIISAKPIKIIPEPRILRVYFQILGKTTVEVENIPGVKD